MLSLASCNSDYSNLTYSGSAPPVAPLEPPASTFFLIAGPVEPVVVVGLLAPILETPLLAAGLGAVYLAISPILDPPPM